VRRRLDAELVRRHLVESREQAHRWIAERRVRVSGTIAEKPARLVAAGEPIELLGDGPRYVSRGGEKLHAALATFGIDVGGRDAFDAGASTGGFTDCLLRHGARSVVAVDVGHGQLHERIRSDARVEVHERVNLRTVDPAGHFAGRHFSLVVGDLSFISLTSLADNLLAVAAPDADLVLLVKPQFEAGRVEVSRGRGVIGDPAVWARTLTTVADAFAGRGAVMMGAMVSPITGTDGNVEFLLHLRAPGAVGAKAQRVETADRAETAADRSAWIGMAVEAARSRRDGPLPVTDPVPLIEPAPPVAS
jgi:23S rRNA (cytidine1920-2'-O)/16S rRNA (cytidine1409-2'-O)-methyltransferase